MYRGNPPKKGQKVPGWPKRHGLTDTKVHMAWRQMKKRCQNPKSKPYKNYGARGITVCERWQSFDNFFEDMGHPPEGMSLERIDNDGPYSPDNCKWASWKQQQRNKRSNRYLSINEERKVLSEWAEELGCTPSTIGQIAKKNNYFIQTKVSPKEFFKNIIRPQK